ncbi:MAG: dihydroneopterin aldolase [Bacteroidales bacterium]|nr:dihydroneopterin aldolase [Bacteroidales bacterium]
MAHILKEKIMSMIAIEGMEFYAYHGCFEEEKIIGTSFVVDLYFNTDTSEAEKTDNLSKTVNYLDVYQSVKKQMQIGSNLLEHISRRILLAVQHEFPQVEWAKVKIQKLNPPLGGKMKSVSVTLTTDDIEKE